MSSRLAIVGAFCIALVAGCGSSSVTATSPRTSLEPTPSPAPPTPSEATPSEATPSELATPTSASAAVFTSATYGYRISLPSGWVAYPATSRWDGSGAPSHDGPFVDLFLWGSPHNLVAWANTAPFSGSLATYVDERSKAAAKDHPCPPKAATNEGITVDGEMARFLGMYCPTPGGILVLGALIVRQGVGIVFSFQDPSGDPSAETADRAYFLDLLKTVHFTR